MLRRLEAAQPQLRERFYLNLAHGNPARVARALAREAEYLNVATEGGSFLCVAVVGEEEENLPVSDDTEVMLLNGMLQADALGAWFGAAMECHLIPEQEDMLVILHDGAEDAQETVARVRSLCERFAAAHTGLNANLYFGVGTPQDSLWKIAGSIEAARRAVSRRFVYGDQMVFCETGENGDVLSFLSHVTEAQGLITQLLLHRDTAALDEVIDGLTKDAVLKLKDQNLTAPYLVILMSGVLGQISHEGLDLKESENIVSALAARGRRPLNVHEIAQLLRSFCLSAVDALEQSQQTYRQQLLGSVRAYIRDHLADKQLRLETIADEAHLAYSHLSRVFKQSEGISVSEYITNQRIEKARLLLRNTSEPISFISDQVGYSSPYYFSACFKKTTGLTPSEYRKGEEAGDA